MRTFTTKPREFPDAIQFTLDGIVYTCREMGALAISDLARMQGTDALSTESIAFIAEFFEMVLGEGQYRDFKRNCQRFNTDDETLVHVVEGIFEDMTQRDAGRPTSRPSDSSDGPQTMKASSTGDFSSRALARLAGRPDLQQALVLASRED
jgi:hypothetical protein